MLTISVPFFHRSLSRRVPVTICLILGTWMALGVQAQPGPSIKASAVEQMQILREVKESRSSAQQKISSRLLLELDEMRGAEYLERLPALQVPRARKVDGKVLVDLTASVDVGLLARIESLSGEVVNAHPRWQSVRARLPLESLERLALEPQIRNIRPADHYITQMTNTTEGDVAHGTDVTRANLNVDGTGVSAGAMSDSVEALAALQGSGDLPANVTVLPGQAGAGTSEGTALMEIIHDMAPGADLFFATGQGGQAQMAQNILDLAAAGCTVITDDVLYLTEPVFQDGVIAQAVDTVAAQGVMYFTSAGNSGNFNDGTSGVWEGEYVGTALPGPITGAAMSAHNFGGGINSNELTEDPPFFITLQWANPFGAASDDLDLYLLDAALANIVLFSTTTQNGNDDPVEVIDSLAVDHAGNRVVVALFGGSEPFFHVNTHRGRLDIGTNGQIFGHPGALGALTIGAVNVADAMGGQFTGGPDVEVEFFSSDGPRRIFFNPDGTPVGVAGNTDSLGIPNSEVRQKPDVVAADGVSTATPGFNPFFGTSASAPHAAGISALFDELFPTVSVSNAYDTFRSSALDIEDPGFDNDSGAGIMMGNEDSFNNVLFADGFESGDASAWQ